MTTRMTETQAQALAALIVRLRAADDMPAWDQPGILAKLREASATSSSWDLARAAINLAENRDLKTPGVLPKPGDHWLRPDGTKAARRGDHGVRCPDPDHGGERMPCGQCASNTGAPPAEVLADIAAAIEHGKANQRQRDAEKAAREAAKENR